MNSNTVNKVILSGIIVSEPEWEQYLAEDHLFFFLVTTEHVRKNTGFVDHMEYHKILLRSKSLLGELQLSKGQYIFIEGKLRTIKRISKQSGAEYDTRILANMVSVFNGADTQTGSERR